MDAVKAKLIEELQYNSDMAQQPLEQRLADTATWFFANKDRIPRDNLASKNLFLEKTCWLLIEISALLLERVHEVEGKSKSLWLPKGVTARGDLKRLG